MRGRGFGSEGCFAARLPGPKPRRATLSKFWGKIGMDQLALFAVEGRPRKAGREDAVSIRSGRVGSIRFGATEGSYALTRSVLSALAVASTDADADVPQGESA